MKLTKQIQVILEKETTNGLFRDALYYPEDKVPDEKQITADAQSRIDNWVEMIKNPPVVEIVEPTIEDFQTQQSEFLRQADELTVKIIERGTAIEKAKMKTEAEPQIDKIKNKLTEM